MYLVVGLGNPGKQYEATRHNMGFDTIDVLVERHKIPQGGVKFNAMYGSGIHWGREGNLYETFVFYEFKRWSGTGDGCLFQNRSGE